MRMRMKWLMKHPIQAKYLLIVLLAMLGPMLVLGYCLYHLVFNLLAREMVFPEAIMTNIVPVVDEVNNVLVLILPAIVLVILYLALVISHRFAGPIERLESDLDEVIAGNYHHRIRVRKHDDLAGVVQRLNVLVKILKEKHHSK